MKVMHKPTQTEAWLVSDLKDMDRSTMPDEVMSVLLDGKLITGNQWQLLTSSGWALCNDTDYLVLDVKGELYPVSKEVFDQTYEILDSAVG